MAAVMTIGTAVTAHAEEFQSEKSWAVTFDGKKMNSNFKSSEMDEEIYRIQPGDTIELQVALKNADTGETDWYMTNEVLKSLEESQSVAEGGSYTYILTYVDPSKEEKVLFSSETVGGEGSSGAGEGLQQATDGLDEYLYLGRLKSNESGSVRLSVTLDGETQGNAYQDTLAQLQMNFAVEKVAPGTRTEEVTINRPGRTINKLIRTYPKTGDTAPILALSAAALASGIILLILGLRAMKKRREDKRGEGQS